MAKSKTKLKPRESRRSTDESKSLDLPDPGATPAESELKPDRPQPVLFAVSLVLFIGWLLFLAYVAYRVLA